MTEPATFVLHRRSSLDPRHVETPDEEVIEAVCRWGTETLSVRHLRDGERFVLSADSDDHAADLHVRSSEIGGESKTWVCIQKRSGRWWVLLPPAVRSGVRELAIEPGELIVFWVGAIEVRVRRVRAGRAAARSGRSDRPMVGAFIAACVVSVSVIGLAKVQHDRDESLRFGELIDSAADHESYLRGLVARTQRAVSAAGEGAAGARGSHDQSPLGAPTIEAQRGSATRGGRHVGLRPRRQGEPAPVSVANTGVFAALGNTPTGAPVNPFMGLSERGATALGAAGGGEIGDSVADAFGYGGLGGGVRSAGTITGGMYGVCGCMEGPTVRAFFGLSTATAGTLERARTVALAPMRERTTSGLRVCGRDIAAGETSPCAPSVIGGSYPADRIRRIVRRNMGQFERCYEQSLARNASSEGRVSVRFVLSAEGSVLASSVEGNSSGDELLATCVAQTFRRLQFDPPARESLVVVSYPMTFASD
ncbi:MAG: AgmX/PglI C-terminal domain-containing protein [Polyangiales bacterium]